MTDIKPENRAFYRSTLFLRTLYHKGLRHVIISPGSRSTPLTLAAAAMEPLRKHVILDERSAAFTALGIGKATAMPAALICTSGTAAANYLPAVIEARKSGVPMLLCTADRPPHLQGTGANQTINQQNLYGKYVVNFTDVGEPEANKEEQEAICNVAERVIQISRSHGGPVHLNFPFRKPLEPDRKFMRDVSEENNNLLALSDPDPLSFPEPTTLRESISEQLRKAERPIMIIGQLAPVSDIQALASLAEKYHLPVLSESGKSNSTFFIEGFEGFLRKNDNAKKLQPDLILRFGRQPASKSLLQAIQEWSNVDHIHFRDTDEKSDIGGTTTQFEDWSGRLHEIDQPAPRPAGWLRLWKESEHRYRNQVQSQFNSTSALTDLEVYHHIAPAIPESWNIFVSNSFPARDHSMVGRWNGQRIYTNRGVSGIDGITSTALGIDIANEKPCILFTGDLAFLHDTNALLNHDKLDAPLIVIVINNQGGSIFRMLPVARHEEYFPAYFETPQQSNITALANSYGIEATTLTSSEELAAINIPQLAEGRSMLQVVECQTEADASMKLRRNLWDWTL